MAVGVVLLVAFGFYQRHRDRAGLDPLVTPSVFSHRGYSGVACSSPMLFFAGLGGTLLCATLFLQIGQGYTPIHAAICTVPLSVGLIIGSGLSGGLLGPKFGRLTIQGGVVVTGVGWALVALAARAHHELGFVGLLPGLLLAGLGLGLVVAPMFDIVLAAVTDRETGSASGVLNAAQQLATSIGIAAFGTVFFDAVAGGDFHSGLVRAMVVEACSPWWACWRSRRCCHGSRARSHRPTEPSDPGVGYGVALPSALTSERPLNPQSEPLSSQVSNYEG